MVRKTLLAALAATALAAPAPAQDLGEIVTGVAREYLRLEQDRAAYAEARQAGTLRAYQSYLERFPQGAHAAEARRQIEDLRGAAARPAERGSLANPYAGGGTQLTRDQRLAVQQRLNALGYTTGGIDGSFGPGTRRAIGLWQRDRGYAQTGLLTRAEADEILRGAATAPVPQAEPGPGTVTLAGAAQVEAELRLSRDQRRAIQAGLTRQGFDTRGVDGIFGRGTRAAITAWQRANDAQPTGYLTAAQAGLLMR